MRSAPDPAGPDRAARRLLLGFAAVLVLAGIGGVGAGLTAWSGPAAPARAAQAVQVAGHPPLSASAPLRLEIATIGVRADIVPVGLGRGGSIATPALESRNQAAWYERGPTPGELGPAVIVGHVDSAGGPSVFYRLSRLRPGQSVEVARRDGSWAVFRIDSVEQFHKRAFPDQRVYRDFGRAGLRLITCGGGFDPGRHEYTDNVVVFATLAAVR